MSPTSSTYTTVKVCAATECGRKFYRQPDQSDQSWQLTRYCDQESCIDRRLGPGASSKSSRRTAERRRIQPPDIKPAKRDPHWRLRAACQGEDPELFFPVAEHGEINESAIELTKAICARCPVRAECLEDALHRSPEGTRGGYTEWERRRMRQRGLTRGQQPGCAA